MSDGLAQLPSVPGVCPRICERMLRLEEREAFAAQSRGIDEQVLELAQWLAEETRHETPLLALRSAIIQATGITDEELNTIVAQRLMARH